MNKKFIIIRWMKCIETSRLCFRISMSVFLALAIVFLYLSFQYGNGRVTDDMFALCGINYGLSFAFLVGVRKAFKVAKTFGPYNSIKEFFLFIKKPNWYRNFCWIMFYVCFITAMIGTVKLIILLAN